MTSEMYEKERLILKGPITPFYPLASDGSVPNILELNLVEPAKWQPPTFDLVCDTCYRSKHIVNAQQTLVDWQVRYAR